MIYTDMLGRELKIGDILAYPLTVGRSANMGVYRILEIKDSTGWRHVGPGKYDHGDKPVPSVKAEQLDSTYTTKYGSSPRPSSLQFADIRGIVITDIYKATT